MPIVQLLSLLALSVVDDASAWKLETVITSDGISQRRAFGHNILGDRFSQSTSSHFRNYSDAHVNDSEAAANHTQSKSHTIAVEIAEVSSNHRRSAIYDHNESGAVVHNVKSKSDTTAEPSSEHRQSAIRESGEARTSKGRYMTAYCILLCLALLCFCFGYCYALHDRETDDDTSSISGSSSDEVEGTGIKALIPSKPKDTAKDLGLLAWLPSITANTLISEGPPLNLKALVPEWTASKVHEILKTYGIPVSNWTDSALTDLARELTQCKARLFRKNDTLIRVIDMVIVIVHHKGEGMVIQEMSHPPYRRGFDTIKERTPKGRMNFNESITNCAKRCLKEKLQAPDGMIENLELDVLSISEKIESLDFMPGLTSVVRNYVVQVDVSSADSEDLERIGGPHGRLEIKGYRYTWMKAKEVTNLRKHMKKQMSRKMRLQKVVMDASAEPVLAWSEEEVLTHLADAGVRREDAERLWNVDLKTLVGQLRNGQLFLARGESDRLLCVEDTVILYAFSKDDMVLVQATTNKKNGKRELPSIRKLANESAWSASFRMAFLHLGIMSPNFHMTEETTGPSRREVVRGRIKRDFIVRAHIDENVPQTLAGLNDTDSDADADDASDDVFDT